MRSRKRTIHLAIQRKRRWRFIAVLWHTKCRYSDCNYWHSCMEETEQDDNSLFHLKVFAKIQPEPVIIVHCLQNSICSSKGERIVEWNNKNYAEVFNLLLHKPRILSSWKSNQRSIKTQLYWTRFGLSQLSFSKGQAVFFFTTKMLSERYFMDANVIHSLPK